MRSLVYAMLLWVILSIPASAQRVELEFTVIDVPGRMRVRGNFDIGDTASLVCHTGNWKILSNRGGGQIQLECVR